MANKYWVGGTGTWDAATTTNWSLTSGGTGGAAVPTTADIAIFDSASNIAGAGASYTVTRTATTNVLGIRMANPSAGTLTFAGSSVIGITTSGLSITGTVNWTNTGTMTFSGTTSVCNTGTTTITSPVVVNGTSITVTLNGAFSTSSSFTLTAGTIALSTFALTSSTAIISGSTTRTFNFGTGSLNLTGNNATIFNAATQTGLTVSGSTTINCTYSGSVGTRTISAYYADFNISAGSDIILFISGNVRDLNFTGFSGTVSNIAINIYGNLTLSPTMTLTAGANAWSFLFFATSSNTITTNGILLDFPVTFNGTGRTWVLQDNLTVGATRTVTFTNGTLDLSTFTATCGPVTMVTGTFNLNNSTLNCTSVAHTSGTLNVLSGNGTIVCSGAYTHSAGTLFMNVANGVTVASYTSTTTSTRGINFGLTPGSNLYITGTNATVFNITSATGWTTTSGIASSGIYLTSNGGVGQTRTVTIPALTAANSISVFVTQGADTITLPASAIKSLTFESAFTGTLANITRTIYGSLTLSSSMTLTAGANIWTFGGSGNLTTNGEILDFPVTVNSVGGGIFLQDNLTMGSTRTLTLTAGLLSSNGVYTISTGFLNISGATTRTLSAVVVNLTGNAGTIFNAATQTSLTITGTPIFNCTYSGATGTRTISTGSVNTTFDFNITAGTDIVIFAAGRFNNLDFTGFSGTLSASTGALSIYGNLTMSPTMTQSSTGIITFASTTTGKTITSAGEILPEIVFNGVGGGWTLTDALNTGTQNINVVNGTFDTGSFNVTAGSLDGTTFAGGIAATINLGTSIVNLSSALSFPTSTLTFSGASSTINISNAAPTFSGGNQTFGTVNFTSTVITTASIVNTNTFDILSFAAKTSAISSTIRLFADQTITTSFNIPSTNARYRYFVEGSGVVRSISATAVSLSDVDFNSVNGAGSAAPLTGTRLGNQGNNTNITFTSKTVYWNLAGSQNWSADAWALTSGGTPALDNFPLTQDISIFDNAGAAGNVIMEQAWNTGTINMTARTTGMTFTTTSFGPNVYGDFKLGSGITMNGAGNINITMFGLGTPTTILSAGKTWNNQLLIQGNVVLGDAFITGGNVFNVSSGEFDAAGYNFTCPNVLQSNSGLVRTIKMGSGTWSVGGQTPLNLSVSNLTLDPGTSTLNLTSTGSSGVFFNGLGLTFYNVVFTAQNLTGFIITGSNTFNNLTFPANVITNENSGNITFNADTIINGTLTTLAATANAAYRNKIKSNSAGTQRTITAAAVNLNTVDFQDIIAAGTATWTGVSLSTVIYGNNVGITDSPPKTVYWNLSGSVNWNTVGWASTSGGTPNGLNYPLPQDTAIFDNAGAAGTVIMDKEYYTGTIDMSARTSAMTFSFPSGGTYIIKVYGDLKLGTGVNLSIASSNFTMNMLSPPPIVGSRSTVLQSVGRSWANMFFILQNTAGVTLNDSFTSTITVTLAAGTLNLNNFILTSGTNGSFISNNTNTRSINFGTSGRIVVSGIGTVWNTATVTNFTTSGTTRVDCTNSSSSARTISAGALSEDNSISFNITAGTGTFTFTANNTVKNLNFTGFAGSWTNVAMTIYGSLTVSTGMTVTAGTSTVSFASTYTGNTINPNGKTLGFPILFAGLFGEWTLLNNLSTGTTATSIVTHAAGTLILGTRTITCPAFNTNSTYLRTLDFGTGSITVNGTGTVWDATNTYNMTVAGTPVVNVTNATATARTIIAGTHSETNSISFNISAGTSITTVGGNIRNLSFTGFSGTLPNTAITIYGNLTLSTGMTVTAGAVATTFAATSTGKTITSSGKTIGCPVTFNGVGGEWTLQDALNTGTNGITLTNGSFITNNFNVTATFFSSSNSNVRSITLGSSTVTLSSSWQVNSSITIDAGTSTIILTPSSSTFNGGDKTYYNVSFTTVIPQTFPILSNSTITGNNIFNNLSFNAPTATGHISYNIGGDQTVNGTFTVGASTGPAYRVTFINALITDTQRTLTVAAVSTLTDVDFKGIVVAGASAPWSGTRLGDGGNNSNITFDAPKTVYWNLTGAQNWSANAWALTSGGTPAVNNFPLIQDTAVFNNTGAATTVTFNIGYYVGTIDMSARTTAMTLTNLTIYLTTIFGDLKLGTGVTLSGTGNYIQFFGYNKTQTLTSAGKTLLGSIQQYSLSSTLLLGDALNLGANSLNIYGTFDTGTNYSVTAGSIISQGSTVAKTFNLNNSTITLSNTGTAFRAYPVDTVNAGTSTITLTSASGTFAGGDKTYHNVTFNNTAITSASIQGSNTFTNLNIPGRSGSVGLSQIIFSGDQTINGTLTIGSGAGAIYRTWLRSDVQGTARTITANARSSLFDVDFRDITAAGAAGTWSGTRLGNCGNNTNITTSTPKTVYWNLTGSQNWSATAWATTQAGTPTVNNFPLAQDTALFTNTGVGTTVTVNANWNIGTINYSARTTASTLATGVTTPIIYGNVTLYTGLTISGSGGIIFAKYSGTQTIISAGRTFPFVLQFQSIAGTISLGDALITSSQLYQAAGTFDLNGFTATCDRFANTSFPAGAVRLIVFGSSSINITGNSTTVLSIIGSDFTYTGTPTINLTYSGATGTRDLQGSTTETNSPNINITAGTDIILFNSNDVLNYDDTGFTGTYSTSGALNIYGNLTARNTPGRVNFLATSGTKNITLTTTAISGILYFNCPGATYQLQSDIDTSGSTTSTGYVVTSLLTTGIILQSGTFDANGYNVNFLRFNSNFTTARTLNLGSGAWNVYGIEGMAAISIFSSSFESLFSNTYSWDITDSTNLTLIPGTSTINLSHFSYAQTFTTIPLTRYLYMGGLTYNNIVISPLRFGVTETRKTYAIYGNNTFNTITNTAQPTTVSFAENSVNTFTDFLLSGTTGNLITINSISTPIGLHTLVKASGIVSTSNCSINNSIATGGASWRAYTINGNFDGGNNTGWLFAPDQYITMTGAAGVNGYQFEP